MGNVETSLADSKRKQWLEKHPKHFVTTSKQFKTANEMRSIVQWVRENTVGDSTASIHNIGKDNQLYMKWLFDNNEDAVYFKVVMG